jgi:hypothetical protein
MNSYFARVWLVHSPQLMIWMGLDSHFASISERSVSPNQPKSKDRNFFKVYFLWLSVLLLKMPACP